MTTPRWWRRKAIALPVAVLTLTVAGAAIVITNHVHANASHTPQHVVAYGPQRRLPFDNLFADSELAVDIDGDVYLSVPECASCTDDPNHYNHVVKLAAGATTPTVLPFVGLDDPRALFVDSTGNVYVTDHEDRVLKLAAGSNTQTVLPFTGLDHPEGVAVDTAGDVYVADLGNTDNHGRVVKLAAGSNTQTVMPFTGLSISLGGVAVDGVGDVFVTDFDNSRVVKLSTGSNTQTVLPLSGLSGPLGVAVDGVGDLYVTDFGNARVLKLAAGSNTPTVLPFKGLHGPRFVAVDAAGDVYVTDPAGQLLKLPGLENSNGGQIPLPASQTHTVPPPSTPSTPSPAAPAAPAAPAHSMPVPQPTHGSAVELPFTGVTMPLGVSVDPAGDLYVVVDDSSSPSQVLKLAAGSSTPVG